MIRRLFPPKNILHPNENNDTGVNKNKRSCLWSKSSSHVVSSPSIDVLKDKTSARTVRIRLVFMRIGEIDTLNERYQADVYYEARWEDTIDVNALKLEPGQKSQILNQDIIVRINDPKFTLPWSPQLFIENSVTQVGDQEKWFTIMKHSGEKHESSPSTVRLDICEHRRTKGLFWEKLELNHFPADVQDLTISISTHLYIENCILVPDERLRSSINREAFYDQQEWKLYEHVAIELRQTQEEYSFQEDDSGIAQKKHPILAVTCRAARRPGYYYWNGFCLIFLITICAFCIFSIPPDLPQSRLQITCTLLLTSITFRWVVNRSLPTISYLTTLDKYAIISIMMLVLLCVWHSIIASIIFLNPERALEKSIAPKNVFANFDRYVCIGAFITYILIHIFLIIWLICVPYKRRREMEYLDREYADDKHIQLDTTRKRFNSIQPPSQDLVFRRASSLHSVLPVIKSPIRSMKHSDNVVIMSNPASFLPIKEETKESILTSDHTIELQGEDDVFYDHTNDEMKTTQIQSNQRF